MTTQRINRAIAHLDLEIVYTRGDGYFYFIDTNTGDQIGDSVFVCYMNQLTIEQWVNTATFARNNHES